MQQQFVAKTSPYIRKEASTKRMMIDVLIALVPSVAFAIYKFKLNALWILLVSIAVMVLTEVASLLLFDRGETGTFIQKVKQRYQKLSINHITAPMVSAVIYALLIPDKMNLGVVAFGAFVGIFVGKMIFGGLGTNIFNPAATGCVIIALAFASFFQGSYSGVDAVSGATPLSSGFPFGLDSYSLSSLFFGNIPGSIGEVNSFAILIGAAYLFIRRSADFRPALSALLVFVVLSAIVGFVKYPNDAFNYVLYQVLSGGLLFGLAFMITDPVTSPVTRPGRWIYGLIVGTLVFAIRLFGVLPEGVAFALLIANALVPLLDYPKWASNAYSKKFIIGYVTSFVVISLLTFLVVGGYII